MTYSVRTTAQFEEELETTYLYIADTLGMARSAERFLDEYASKLELLSTFPNGFPVDEEVSKRVGADIRKITLRAYKIEYIVDEDSRAVHLLTLMPMSMNNPPLFLDTTSSN